MKKGDMAFENIIKWLIAILILILIIVFLTTMKGKSLDIVDKMKNLLRFGI